MKKLLPNGTTWSNGRLVDHEFDGLDYDAAIGLLNLPVDCQLVDEQGDRWFLGLFPGTEPSPSNLLDRSFTNRKCRVSGEKGKKMDLGVGTIRVIKIEWIR